MPEQASAFMREPFRTSLVRAVLWQTEEGSGVIPSLVQHGWDVNRPSVTVVDGGEAVVMHPLVIACLEGRLPVHPATPAVMARSDDGRPAVAFPTD